MKVHVFKLRARGKKIPNEELKHASSLEGDLEVIKYQTNTRTYNYARVWVRYGGGRTEELCHLYEPKLVSIEGDSMLFDGVEKEKTGEMFFQQWRCFVGTAEGKLGPDMEQTGP